MNKKLQVFVSSTYTDLIEERQAAVEAILDAGHIPAGMELFKAGKSQLKTIYKWIDESDVYLLILGGRYGSIEEESGLSYTELEYKYALSKNMPVFAIILSDRFLHQKASMIGGINTFENDNKEKLNLFKQFIKKNIVKFANNIDQISTIVHSQLNHIINDDEYNLIGWIRGDSINVIKNSKINHNSNTEKLYIHKHDETRNTLGENREKTITSLSPHNTEHQQQTLGKILNVFSSSPSKTDNDEFEFVFLKPDEDEFEFEFLNYDGDNE